MGGEGGYEISSPDKTAKKSPRTAKRKLTKGERNAIIYLQIRFACVTVGIGLGGAQTFSRKYQSFGAEPPICRRHRTDVDVYIRARG